MKRFELTFAFLQLPLDYLLLVLAGISAYSLRFTSFMKDIRPVIFNLPWDRYWPLVLAVSLIWVIIFAFSGLYHTDPNRKLLRDLNRLLLACSTGFAGITIYVFFTLQKFDSRFLVLAGWILAIVYVAIGRILMKGIKVLCYRAGVGLRRTAIIGNEIIAKQIIADLQSKKGLGYKIVGVYAHFDDRAKGALIQEKPDEIIFTDPKSREAEAIEAIDFANEHHITFKYSADLFATLSSNLAVSTIAGGPIVELRRTRLTGWPMIEKRTFDLLVGIILIIVFSPLYLLIALIILLTTGRPIIYKNERVGKKGQTFSTYKFRSMYQKYCTGAQFGTTGEQALQTEKELIESQNTKTGPVYKIKDDPRVTRFGRWLRKYSLDELPQFFNVIGGNMSLVGPRPHQPREVAKYALHHKTLLAIKPGVTGMAQISGRSDLTFEEEAKLDTFYIEHWSWIIDLVILIKTPFIVLRKKGAW